MKVSQAPGSMREGRPGTNASSVTPGGSVAVSASPSMLAGSSVSVAPFASRTSKVATGLAGGGATNGPASGGASLPADCETTKATMPPPTSSASTSTATVTGATSRRLDGEGGVRGSSSATRQS